MGLIAKQNFKGSIIFGGLDTMKYAGSLSKLPFSASGVAQFGER
jgi:hypothetical protein